MRIVFNGKILDDRFLQRVDYMPSETEGKVDAVALPGGDEKVVLKTFETEQEAIDYIDGLSEKLIAQMDADDIIDAR